MYTISLEVSCQKDTCAETVGKEPPCSLELLVVRMDEVRNWRPLAPAKEAKERKGRSEDGRTWVLEMLPELLNQHAFIRSSKGFFS